MVVTTFIITLIVGLIVAVLRSEFEAWMPWIAERLRRQALKSLSGPLRDRFDEEWAAHLDETPGYIGKVWQAVGFNIASSKISSAEVISDFIGKLIHKVSLGMIYAGGSIIGTSMKFWSEKNVSSLQSKTAITVAASGVFIVYKSKKVAVFRAKFIKDMDHREMYLQIIDTAYQSLPYRGSNKPN